MVSKLLSQESDLRNLKWSLLLERCLTAAINYQQKSVVPILLKSLPLGTSLFLFESQNSHMHLRRSSSTNTEVIEAALEYAAAKNSAWAVLLLLKHGARASSPHGLQGIYKAASCGYEEVVRILSKRIRGNKHPKMFEALASAVREGHEGTVKVLLDRRIEMPQDPLVPGMIHLAARKGHESILKLLLSKVPGDYYVHPRIYPDENDTVYSSYAGLRGRDESRLEYDKYWCCLHFAIYHGRYEIVKFLLEKSITPRDHDENKAMALPLAAQRGETDIFKLLLETGFDISAKLDGKCPLELAARFGHTDIMSLLIDAGVKVTPYHLLNAAASGSISAVSLLLDQGVNVQEKSFEHKTPLHVAVAHCHLEIVHLLLKRGAKPEATERYGQTPLLLAVTGNQTKCLYLLLEYCKAKESQSETMHTKREIQDALVMAIRCKRPHMIPRLLQYGASIEEGDSSGKMPLHVAANTRHTDTLETVLASGAKIHTRDAQQRTALHYAAANSDVEAISMLLDCGLDVNARDSRGRVPLHLVHHESISHAYKLLLNHGANIKAQDNDGYDVTYYQRQSYYTHNCA